MKRPCRWLPAILLALLLTLLPVSPARAEEGETVRVGLYDRDDYHVIDDQSRHSGYDHEYLLEIAKYTGWTYEFVEGTWQECVAMLEAGEIDLLGGVEKRAEWQETMCFADAPSAYAASCLLIAEDSDRFAYEDHRAFDGMRVGILADSAFAEKLEAYSRENRFTYTLREYGTEEQLAEALRLGEIDCIGASDFRNLSRYKIVARFGDAELYYATSRRRSGLKEALDAALHEIHERDSFFEYHLHDKYFTSAVRIAFSQRELAYIRDNPVVQVALFRDVPEFCEYDESTGRYSGIIIDVLEQLSQATGFRFEYTELPADQMPWEFVYENPNVLIAPFFQNDLIHYSDEMRFLNTILPGNMVAVTREKDKDLLLDPAGTFKLAIPRGMYGASEDIRRMFPTGEIVFSESHEDGLEMVWRGRADMTLVNEFLATYLLQSPYYDHMNVFYLGPVVENTTMGLGSASDGELISILNKAIRSTNHLDTQQFVMQYMVEHPYELSAGEFLYEYWPSLLLAAVLLLGGGAAWYLDQRRRKAMYEQSVQLRAAREKLSAEEAYQKELFRRANFDELTGLYNHHYFLEKATELLREDGGAVYTFFHVNLSDFKLINEVYGTEQGNAVLLETAERLKKMVGGEGLLGRLYADQFVICYPLAKKYLDELPYRQTLFHYDCGGKTICVQAEVGVFINDQHIRSAVQAIAYARMALQNHEAPSRNHIYVYRDAYRDKLLLNQAITSEMESALADGQFQVLLQPQYDIQSRRLVSAEALVRWDHPTRGLLSPGVFIPVLEMNGFICRLDLFVFETVCRLLAEWRERGRLIPVSVNLSRVDLQNPELLPGMREILGRYGIPPAYLHLEITESAYVEDDGAFYRVIEELRRAGFLIEMDDFGSGYSSLNMLKDIPVDVLKLDMKFFSREVNMDRGGNIIAAVVNLAHNLGILVVAEGVETEREANFLRSIHCLVAQGYLYGRPMAAEDFRRLLDTAEIGEKMRPIAPGDAFYAENLYWEIEQFNVLLRHSGMLLFDYDPTKDRAHVVAGEPMAPLTALDLPEYTKKLLQKFRVHPDYEKVIVGALTSPEPDPVEVDFLADCYQTGAFEWFHATAYHYCAAGRINRVIGLIRRRAE